MNAAQSIVARTFPKSWEGCEPPTADERMAEFKWKWYAHGHHHDENLGLKIGDEVENAQ